jgi:hypothetical protein
MKRIVSALSALAVLAALAIVAATSKHSVRLVYAASGCSNATLRGNYGFDFSGFSGTGSEQCPFYGAGLLTFDGKGNVSGPFTYALNGGGGVPSTYNAIYTVNPDCTVSFTGTNGSDSAVGVIVSGGAEVLATDTSAPDTLNVDFKKQ